MLEKLDRTSRRVIGVLVEKELTTPQQYPLSVNALVNGCNQRSNRDPVLHLQDFEVEGALRSLLLSGWVTEVRGGSRVIKWKHRADEKLGATPDELTVMTELFLRGPQQPGELRTRVNRMHPCASVADVEDTLRRLSERGLVRQLVKKVGERIPRWDHLLYPESEATHDEQGFASSGTTVHAVVGPSGERQELPTPPSAQPLPTAIDEDETAESAVIPPSDDLEERVENLERTLAELRRRIAALEANGGATSGPHD